MSNGMYGWFSKLGNTAKAKQCVELFWRVGRVWFIASALKAEGV